MIKDWIHDALTPPLHELMASLHGPKPQSTIAMEIVGHIVTPMEKSIFRTVFLISRIDLVRIHMLPDL